MNYIERTLSKYINQNLFKQKAIIIYGARQVGKTTLVKKILENHSNSIYLNCDEPDIRTRLTNKTSTELKSLVGKKNPVVIDEAQRVENIGISIKLLADNYPDIQIIATGSSSFELSNNIKEPLTGRKIEVNLYPLSFNELKSIYSEIELERILEDRIIYGQYPAIIENNNINDLKSLADSYLFKDILQFNQIKNHDVLTRLLQALALQIGNEVSYNELASLIGIDKNTVSNYIKILEQAFIIFRLNPLSRNLRNELKKLRKIYFFDTGIRNAVINNFNPLNLRLDSGALFENFIISERIKYNNNMLLNKNLFFWRTHQQKEIDLVEEYNGEFHGYEFKLKEKKLKKHKEFLDNYENSTIELITRDNFLEFILQTE